MIKTGQVGNVVLGIGDPSKFNLLGGSFGEAGDYIVGRFGGLSRAALKKREEMGQGGQGRGYGEGGAASRNPREQRDWIDRWRRRE